MDPHSLVQKEKCYDKVTVSKPEHICSIVSLYQKGTFQGPGPSCKAPHTPLVVLSNYTLLGN
jgi:hypothetical protein